MRDVLKGSSTANLQLWQVTATSDVILLVFTKRPQTQNTCSWFPGLWLVYSVSGDCWPSCKQQRSQMSALRLKSSTWEAEVGILKSWRLVWATEQNPVSKCQNTKWNQDKDLCCHGDWILMMRLSESNPLTGRFYTSGETQAALTVRLHSSLGTSLAQDPSAEHCSGHFCTMSYYYHKIQGQNHQLWKPEHLELSFKETP